MRAIRQRTQEEQAELIEKFQIRQEGLRQAEPMLEEPMLDMSKGFFEELLEEIIRTK